jgi:hypothetical protein
MSHLKIRQLCEARLRTWAETQNITVFTENETGDPPNNSRPEDNIYLQIFMLPAETESDLSGEIEQFVGVMQINVISPKGIGTGAAGRIAELVKAQFSNGTELVALDGFTMQISTPLSIRAGISGQTDYTIPTSARYFASA